MRPIIHKRFERGLDEYFVRPAARVLQTIDPIGRVVCAFDCDNNNISVNWEIQ